MRALAIVPLLAVLAACSTNNVPTGEKPQLGSIPSDLKRRCEQPAFVANSSQEAVEAALNHDGAALLACGNRHDKLVNWTEERIRRLGGNK